MLKRFVFVLSGPIDSVIDRSDVEIRAESAEEAFRKIGEWAIVRELGASMRLIGERRYGGSDARFCPAVPIELLPAHIIQNERFSGKVSDPEMGVRDAEVARLEALHNIALGAWERSA